MMTTNNVLFLVRNGRADLAAWLLLLESPLCCLPLKGVLAEAAYLKAAFYTEAFRSSKITHIQHG